MSLNISDKMRVIEGLVSNKLKDYFKGRDADYEKVIEAMEYSTLAGGKRIRPFLVISVCEMFSGSRSEAMVYACALEMIHTYSLIHDDLPCMDNDDLRRGNPTCHKVYGEATAMLAGDALLTYAFEIVATASDISAEHKVEAIRLLSHSAGVNGMIGGQQMDLEAENTDITYETMIKIHTLKTGALINCACRLGALAASVSDEKTLGDIDTYSEGVGRVFQLVDDVLDQNSTTKELGKTVHSDEKNNKKTYLSFMPSDIAIGLADVITEKAVDSISGYEKNETLTELAKYLCKRKN